MKAPRSDMERRLVRILRAPDPAKALAAATRDRRLSPATRRALAAANPDGVCISALLVAHLRFARLLRGSVAAASWFDADPRAFTATVRLYHQQTPQTALFPSQEAALFERWRRRRAPG